MLKYDHRHWHYCRQVLCSVRALLSTFTVNSEQYYNCASCACVCTVFQHNNCSVVYSYFIWEKEQLVHTYIYAAMQTNTLCIIHTLLSYRMLTFDLMYLVMDWCSWPTFVQKKIRITRPKMTNRRPLEEKKQNKTIHTPHI